MRTLEAWVVRRSTAIIAVLAIVIAVLSVLTAVLLVEEGQIERRLGPSDRVTVAGPCRTFGPAYPECKRQARLIVKSCLTHKPCRKLVVRFTSGRNELPGRENQPRNGSPTPPETTARDKGVTPSSPPSGSSQPGPPSGGPPSNPPPPRPEPPAPPPKDPPGLLDPVCDLDLPVNPC